MRTYFDCIPCMIRQTLDAIRLITEDESIHEQVLREVLQVTSAADLQRTPPEMGQKIHRLIRQRTKIDDPYREIKKRFNNFALSLYPKLQRIIAESEDPLEMAVRLAIAGNIIDLGVKSSLQPLDVDKTIDEVLTAELDMSAFEDFKKETAAAESILYLADNAGEIVFDKILIEQLGPEKINFAVKGKPVINDATIEDAQETGLTDLVRVISNGYDAPGTILRFCSEEFRGYFEEADLIIAKGQGNYESLSEVDKNIFFLLKAKCSVIANHLNCEVGTPVLRRQSIIYSAELEK
ncbi:MAG: DUF89 family protein [Sedimentisphaerales bacterium]|nr:DUF89 family protein [Sedimentisphaerales bacterium]